MKISWVSLWAGYDKLNPRSESENQNVIFPDSEFILGKQTMFIARMSNKIVFIQSELSNC